MVNLFIKANIDLDGRRKDKFIKDLDNLFLKYEKTQDAGSFEWEETE